MANMVSEPIEAHNYGVCSQFHHMVMHLHKDQRGQVRLHSNLSKLSSVIHRVKQGCVLTLNLLTIFFNMILKQATVSLDDEDGADARDHLMATCSTQVHTKTLE